MTEEAFQLHLQIRRLTLLGPLIALSTLLVMLLSGFAPFNLGILTFAAVLAVSIWGDRAAFAGSCSVIILSALQLTNSEELLLWNAALASAIILTLLITALCQREVDSLLMEIQPPVEIDHSPIREIEDQLAALELRLKEENKQLQSEACKAEERSGQLQIEIDALTSKLQAQSKILHHNEEELQTAKASQMSLHSQYEGLLQELFQRRHEYTLLKQDSEAQEALQEERWQAFQQRHQELEESASLYQRELAECREKSEELLASCQAKEALLQEQIQAATSSSQGSARQEGLYKQLKEQFSEKCTVLDQTRQELFASQEERLRLQKIIAENELEGNTAVVVAALQKQLNATHAELAEAELRHQEEVNTLQEIISHFAASAPAAAPEERSSPPAEQAKASKEKPKSKSAKATKTTTWANTILSRCSESDGPTP